MPFYGAGSGAQGMVRERMEGGTSLSAETRPEGGLGMGQGGSRSGSAVRRAEGYDLPWLQLEVGSSGESVIPQHNII